MAVQTPAARVDYNFAPAIPALTDEDDEPVTGTIQRKSATARVTSPGDLLPVGLSLQCLTQSVNTAGLANTTTVLPLNYITSGQGPTTPTFQAETDNFTNADWTAPYIGTNQSANVFVDGPTTVNQSTGVLSTTIRVNNTSTPALTRATNLSFDIVYAQRKNGAAVATITTVQTLLNVSLLNNTPTNVTVTLPPAVTGSTGGWHFKIRLNTGQLLTPSPRWSAGYGNFTIDPSSTGILGQVGALLEGVTDLDQTLACARLMDSPRPRDGGTPTLTLNIQEGGDHQLGANPNLATVVSNLNLTPGQNDSAAEVLNTVQGLLNNPAAGLTGCAETSVNHRDTAANYLADVIANCGLTRNDAQVEQEFTDGFLQETDSVSDLVPGYGRLRCSRPQACDTPGADAPVALPGFTGTYNNDSFRNFVPSGTTILSSQFAYGLDTYLLPGTPLITPSNNISTTIYGSPRFFWSPVLTYVNLQGPGAFYPILTFRPMFIDNGISNNLPAAGITTSQIADNAPAAVLALVNGVCSKVGALPVLCQAATATLTAAITALGPTPSVNSILTVLNNDPRPARPELQRGPGGRGPADPRQEAQGCAVHDHLARRAPAGAGRLQRPRDRLPRGGSEADQAGQVRRRREEDRGAAALELALIALPLLLVVFGAIQYGYHYWSLQTAAATARELAREVAVGNDEARCKAIAEAAAGGPALGPVTVSYAYSPSKKIGATLTVTVSFESLGVMPLVPLPRNSAGKVVVTQKATQQVQDLKDDPTHC